MLEKKIHKNDPVHPKKPFVSQGSASFPLSAAEIWWGSLACYSLLERQQSFGKCSYKRRPVYFGCAIYFKITGRFLVKIDRENPVKVRFDGIPSSYPILNHHRGSVGIHCSVLVQGALPIPMCHKNNFIHLVLKTRCELKKTHSTHRAAILVTQIAITVSDSNNCWQRWTAHCSQQACQRSHILIARTIENHINHHPIHLHTLDCFLFLLCPICLQLVGHPTVSLVTLFSTLMEVYMQPIHTLSGMKNKRPGFSHNETIQATYATWQGRRTTPDQGKQPIFPLSSPTFTEFKKCSLPVFLSTP